MIRLLKKWPKVHLLMLFLLLAYDTAVAAGAYFLAEAVDSYVNGSKEVYRMLILFASLELLGVGLLTINNMIEERTKANVRLALRNRLSRKTIGYTAAEYQRQEEDFFLNSQISGVDLFSEEYLNNVYQTVNYIGTIILGIFFLGMLYPKLAVGLIAAVGLSYLMSRCYDKKAGSLSERLIQENGRYLTAVRDIFHGFAEICHFRAQRFFIKKAACDTKKYEFERFRYMKNHKLLETAIYTPMFCVDILLLAFLAYGISNGETEIGTLAAFLNLEGLILNSAENLFYCFLNMKSGKAALPSELLDHIEEEDGRQRSEREPERANGIEIEHVGFAYEGHTVLEDTTIRFEEGTHYLFQGRSGCGKTTLFRLLLKELEADKGKILWNGRELKNLSEAELFQMVGYLPQRNHLFHDSIYYNIFFDNRVSEEKIKEILEGCCLENLITSHKEGLQYQINSETDNLSGGEKQRLALARLLADEKKYYLLDEPYNGIDQTTAERIERYLLKKTDRTIIMISHETWNNPESKWVKFKMKEGEMDEGDKT